MISAYRRSLTWSTAHTARKQTGLSWILSKESVQLSTTSPKNSEVVGVVKTRLSNESFIREAKLPKQYGYVGMLAVDSSVQSQGVGTKLMKTVEEYCKYAGAPKMVRDLS